MSTCAVCFFTSHDHSPESIFLMPSWKLRLLGFVNVENGIAGDIAAASTRSGHTCKQRACAARASAKCSK